MVYQNLAPILSAFINRLSQTDILIIQKANNDTWLQQLNGNAGSQQNAANQLDQVIEAAILRMLQHDRDNLKKVIESLT